MEPAKQQFLWCHHQAKLYIFCPISITVVLQSMTASQGDSRGSGLSISLSNYTNTAGRTHFSERAVMSWRLNPRLISVLNNFPPLFSYFFPLCWSVFGVFLLLLFLPSRAGDLIQPPPCRLLTWERKKDFFSTAWFAIRGCLIREWSWNEQISSPQTVLTGSQVDDTHTQACFY